MASSGSRRKKKRKHAGYRGDLRFVKTRPEKKKKKRSSRSASSRNAPSAKKASTVAKRNAVRKKATASSGDGADVRGVTPGWDDLLTDNRSRAASLKTPEGRLAAMSTARVALGILAVTGLFTLYVGHIYATQDVLADLQRIRTENMELHLKKNQLSSAWNRETAPAVIYDRARELGLRESIPQGETIIVED